MNYCCGGDAINDPMCCMIIGISLCCRYYGFVRFIGIWLRGCMRLSLWHGNVYCILQRARTRYPQRKGNIASEITIYIIDYGKMLHDRD